MKYDQHITTLPWSDYELLDSGEHMKLERFGDIVLARPETQAIWGKMCPELWGDAHAEFVLEEKKGVWKVKKPVPESWELSHGPLRFTAHLTNFKHTGIFPEQEPNWSWISTHVRGFVNPSFDEGFTKPLILNLFGYTGIASLAAAEAGAFVTHVDASKQSLDWAHDNARLSQISEDRIRWILDDALAFVKREVKRGIKYDGIILDPPAFGRGAKGEVWKIEQDLLPLLKSLKILLSEETGSFFLLNCYASGYASRSFAQAVESVFSTGGGPASGGGESNGESGDLHIKESSSDRVVPAGIYVRFVR